MNSEDKELISQDKCVYCKGDRKDGETACDLCKEYKYCSEKCREADRKSHTLTCHILRMNRDLQLISRSTDEDELPLPPASPTKDENAPESAVESVKLKKDRKEKKAKRTKGTIPLHLMVFGRGSQLKNEDDDDDTDKENEGVKSDTQKADQMREEWNFIPSLIFMNSTSSETGTVNPDHSIASPEISSSDTSGLKIVVNLDKADCNVLTNLETSTSAKPESTVAAASNTYTSGNTKTTENMKATQPQTDDEYAVASTSEAGNEPSTSLTPWYRCYNCGTQCPKRKACAVCHFITYCSKECQVAHYPKHKDFCKLITATNTDKENEDVKSDIQKADHMSEERNVIQSPKNLRLSETETVTPDHKSIVNPDIRLKIVVNLEHSSADETRCNILANSEIGTSAKPESTTTAVASNACTSGNTKTSANVKATQPQIDDEYAVASTSQDGNKPTTSKTKWFRCYNCGTRCPKRKACAMCHFITYCSKDCQVAHYPKHRNFCKLFVTTEAMGIEIANTLECDDDSDLASGQLASTGRPKDDSASKMQVKHRRDKETVNKISTKLNEKVASVAQTPAAESVEGAEAQKSAKDSQEDEAKMHKVLANLDKLIARIPTEIQPANPGHCDCCHGKCQNVILCSACRRVNYCCRACQRKHFLAHGNFCRQFTAFEDARRLLPSNVTQKIQAAGLRLEQNFDKLEPKNLASRLDIKYSILARIGDSKLLPAKLGLRLEDENKKTLQAVIYTTPDVPYQVSGLRQGDDRPRTLRRCCIPGNFILIYYPSWHMFPDEEIGLRIIDPDQAFFVVMN